MFCSVLFVVAIVVVVAVNVAAIVVVVVVAIVVRRLVGCVFRGNLLDSPLPHRLSH